MPNTYACKLVSNPNVPIFLPRVCTLVLFVSVLFLQLHERTSCSTWFANNWNFAVSLKVEYL